MKTKKKLKPQVGEPVEGPAVIGADHCQDRVLDKTAGARKGWSKLTVYEREFRLGHLRCKERCATRDGAEAEGRLEADRFAAARAFDLGWQLCTASWPGGGSFDLVKTSGGVPGAFVDHQREAKQFWRRVEQAMGANDWLICRRVCGENYSVAAAVTAINPGYRFSTLARFREALDALVGGMRSARRANRAAKERSSGSF
jgi:hypothetical protein